MRVLLNTRPLLFVKTGVGHYVSHLYEKLLCSPGVEVTPTIDPRVTASLQHVGSVSRRIRRLAGNRLPGFARPLFDRFVSKVGGSRTHRSAQIYHETQYDPIPRIALKSVANIYDLSFVLHPHYLSQAVAQKFRFNLRHAVSADRIIVNTEAVKAEVESLTGVDGSRVDVIPLAPPDDYRALTDKAAARRRADKFTARDYILCVGTIEPRKNIPVLLKAYAILREHFPVALVLAGGAGWLSEGIMALPRALGVHEDVVFTGYVGEEDLHCLYSCASVVVSPSLYEGFGLPVVEAMACGTPLIVSDIPSQREVAGDAAMVFQPADHDELAYKLQQLLSSDSLRDTVREKGLQRAARYSWDRVAALTVRTYRQALDS